MSVLISLAAQVGLPMVKAVLERRLGPENGKLATDVLEAVANRAGVAPDQIEELAEKTPGVVIDAMREVERMTPELLSAYDADLRLRLAMLEAEEDEPYWMRAWRPGGMYLLGFLWLWNVVILHVANAIWVIALPPAPWDVLLGLSGLYFSLYMGGHTIKDVIGKWVAK